MIKLPRAKKISTFKIKTTTVNPRNIRHLQKKKQMHVNNSHENLLSLSLNLII